MPTPDVPCVGSVWRRVWKGGQRRPSPPWWVRRVVPELNWLYLVKGPPGTPQWSKHWKRTSLSGFAALYVKVAEPGEMVPDLPEDEIPPGVLTTS
jgi:hypothetical protein